MFLKKIKNLLKRKFPLFANKLIFFRDNNRIIKYFVAKKLINFNKKIHGKYIIHNASNSSNEIFLSYSLRPKFSKDTFKNTTFSHNNKDTAIILQGPVASYEKFVIETIKIYSKIFPDTLIVLSTWRDEASLDLIKFTNSLKNFHLILNEKPFTEHNINLQIFSTFNALSYIKDKNIRYSLKTRTDCRIYNPYSIFFLKSLLSTYKIKNNEKIFHRILSSSIDTRIHRVYGLSDICLFSDTDNLINYFINKTYEDSLKEMKIDISNPIINETAVINEIFLCSRFLINMDYEINWTLEDWWKKCKEIFCIFDANSIDMFWYKYYWMYEQRFVKNYTSKFNQSLQFSDWLNIFNNNTEIYKKYPQEKWNLVNGLLEQKNQF